MNNRTNLTLWGLVLLFAVLMSIPWLVPHAGAVALVGFLPLLFAEAIATHTKTRHFWVMHYSAFVLWNAFTTFWVCNATVGGGIFAVLANAFQMSVVFGLFRQRDVDVVRGEVFAKFRNRAERACFSVRIHCK